MSYVEKTTSDVEKIISDLIFTSGNTLKSKSLQQMFESEYSSEIQNVMQFGRYLLFSKSFGYGIIENREASV